jgi:hypothetical protein
VRRLDKVGAIRLRELGESMNQINLAAPCDVRESPGAASAAKCGVNL